MKFKIEGEAEPEEVSKIIEFFAVNRPSVEKERKPTLSEELKKVIELIKDFDKDKQVAIVTEMVKSGRYSPF